MRLVEEELGSWLRVSRTPVREALLRLTQEGLVQRSRGWVVREHAPEEFLRILEARAAIEGAAAALAATHITADEIAELKQIVDQIDHSGTTRTELNELNKRFHTIVTMAGRNFLLDQFSQRTRISYWNFTIQNLVSPEDNKIANDQHREIIARLEAGDAEGSERMVREHIDRTRRILAEALNL
jgi:DNA-binding GntR family transcriptional regulator